ncbi:MAG TPA: alpha-amylase family glycosyl hydrolase, partial [Propionibacteriaceae bacterium]|nr:alpha-amylase family glycosyl hydrolase [Propionibacteriaceae bacterium]
MHKDVHPGSLAQRDWWKSAVVYQVYPRSFADSDGDGVGDLGGILDHLDHLELLGVDVVWLSPVYRSPMVDNGYDISDYYDVDPLFGTLEQLDELIARLHARDMKLVM